MKAYCCEQRLTTYFEDEQSFAKYCSLCGKIYKQGKRQGGPMIQSPLDELDDRMGELEMKIDELVSRTTYLDGLGEGLSRRLEMQHAHIENLIERIADLENPDDRE